MIALVRRLADRAVVDFGPLGSPQGHDTFLVDIVRFGAAIGEVRPGWRTKRELASLQAIAIQGQIRRR